MPRAIVELAYKTQAGHRHQVEGLGNEDALFATAVHPWLDAVLMVADGMGGHPRPEEASAGAVAAAHAVLFESRTNTDQVDVARVLMTALKAAHLAVRELREGSGRAPGTTLSLAVVSNCVLYLAHVGDGSVFVHQGKEMRVLAGGEDRRTGNRPSQYLGQDEALEPELRKVSISTGDRLLLCTDGLTRYFHEAGPEALEQVIGRRTVAPQAVVSQLLAHSRPDQYDDDTTVALMEVTGITEAPRPVSVQPAAASIQQESLMSNSAPIARSAPSRGHSLAGVLAAAAVGGGLVAAGYFAGRMSVEAPGVSVKPAPVAGELREPISAEELRRLPPGNLVLVDTLGNRIYALGTREGGMARQATDLVAYQVTSGGRLSAAGRFRLDPARQELTDGDGHRYPVLVDAESGSLRILRGGQLAINVSPRARVSVDGRVVGEGPQQLRIPAGRHRVLVETDRSTTESEIEVPAGRTVRIQP